MKSAALFRFALHPDFPTHDADQPRRDAQTESGSTVLSCKGTVGLSEGFKNQFLLLSGYADASIDDAEMKRDVSSLARILLNIDHRLALVCELDGIAHQV